MTKKTNWILVILVIVIMIAILFFPVKYSVNTYLVNNNLHTDIKIVVFRGEKYISEDDLNSILQICNQTKPTKTIEYTYFENGDKISVCLFEDENYRSDFSDSCNIDRKRIFNKNYLSVKKLMDSKILLIEENNKTLTFTFPEETSIKGKARTITPQTALKMGKENLLYLYPLLYKEENLNWTLTEKSGCYTINVKPIDKLGAPIAIDISTSGGIEKVYSEY